MKAVIYARYSSDNQREESIEGQLRECTAFAEKNGITVLRHYIDRAFSAKTDNRPQFQEMIRDSSKKLFDMVIVWKLDRFARNRYDSARYKAILKKNGVKVVSATEIISSGAEGIILESVLEGYAEYFSADLAEKVSRGMTENALKCKFNGGNPPVGYQIDKVQCFQINPLSAPHVLEAFKLYEEGATMTEVRDYLNEHGVRNTRGQAMTYNSVSKMLRNRRYIGEYSYRDVVIPNGIPAIVPEELFERVQQRIEKNRKAPARYKAEEDYLLTTKLFCGYCGAYLCGESGTSHTGVTHRYYKCVSVKKKRADCKKKPVRKQWIEDMVVKATMDMLNNDATIEAIIATVLDLLDRENVNLPLYEQQLRETEAGIENLLNAMQQGILTKSTKTRLEELEATKEELEIKILNEKLAKPKIEPEFLRMYLFKFRQLERDKEEHRKMLVDTFINAIFLYDDKLVITFNYRDGSKTITLRDINETIFRENLGSDIECCGVPRKQEAPFGVSCFLLCRERGSNPSKCNSPVDCCSPGRAPATPLFLPKAKMQIESLSAYQGNIIRTISSLWEMGSDYLFILRGTRTRVLRTEPSQSESIYNNDESRRFFGGSLLLFCFPLCKFPLSFFAHIKGLNVGQYATGKVYNANHNTRAETRAQERHIDHDRTELNVNFQFTNDGKVRKCGSFDAKAFELSRYEFLFIVALQSGCCCLTRFFHQCRAINASS